MSSAGDFNGDGFADVLIGARRELVHGALAGAAFVVFGRDSGFDRTVMLPELDGNNGFRLGGISAFDETGNAVSNAGDVNGDGLDDIVIGARAAEGFGGTGYVVFGRTGQYSPDFDLSTLDGENGFKAAWMPSVMK